MVLLSVANRELVMPRIAEDLQKPAADPHGLKSRVVSAAYEPNGILIAGQTASPSKMTVNGFSCTIPEKLAGSLVHIKARSARYVPPGPPQPSGGWLLTEATPADLPSWQNPVLEVLDPGKFFLRTERVDFETLLRTRNWHQFASTLELFDELQRPEATRLSALAVQLHLRFTLPVLTMIMVVMGLAVILRDQSRGVFLNAGLCVVLAGVFFGTCQLFRHLGEQEYLSPALAAWMPVFFYGPTSVAMFDAIHT
jgi:lipopolysaccharide export system permease protein